MTDSRPDYNPETVAGKQNNNTPEMPDQIDRDNDFVVTEAHATSQELVGLKQNKDETDDLGVQSTANLIDEEAHQPPSQAYAQSMVPEPEEFSQPIGSSLPDLSSQTEAVDNGLPKPGQVIGGEASNLRKLSESEVANIRKELYAEPEDQSRKSAAVRKTELPASMTDAKPFSNTPIVPSDKQAQAAPFENPVLPPMPETDSEAPKEPASQRKVARYYNNVVILPKGSRLHENDELEVRNKLFVLKKKKISPTFVLSVTAPLFVIMVVFAISIFVGGDTGNGRVFGLVVDDYGVPYDGGAVVRFPDLGESYQTDVQGFFETDRLPTGSHQVDYLVAGNVVGREHVTVVDDDITRIIISPGGVDKSTDVADLPSPVPTKKTDYAAPPQMAEVESTKQQTSTPVAQTKQTTTAPVSEGKIILDANVDGASLAIDGKTLGAGNTTYTHIAAGSRQYTVSRLGFEPVTGTINLRSGDRKTLKVTLVPISEEAKAEVYSPDDYFYAANELANTGNFSAAIADYGRAIEGKPSFAEAYEKRGAAYLKISDKQSAFADYLRAGEIYQFQRNLGDATSCFTKARDLNPNAIEPVLGRGHAYLARGENIAAIADFETAVSIDAKSPAARFGLGVARFNHGQYSNAIDEFKKARSLDPKDPATHQYLMLAYMNRNDTKNVKKCYEKFVENVSSDEVAALQNDRRFTAIIRVIEMED